MGEIRPYSWRVDVAIATFQKSLASSADYLRYTNYNNRIHDTHGDEFYSALSRVWSVMHDVEERGS
jgi:hypothetical protein